MKFYCPCFILCDLGPQRGLEENRLLGANTDLEAHRYWEAHRDLRAHGDMGHGERISL